MGRKNKLVLFTGLMAALLMPVLLPGKAGERNPGSIKAAFPFYLYRTYGDAKNFHYYLSGLTGDHSQVSITGHCKKDPFSGTSCIRVSVDYSVELKKPAGWIALNWLYPANNWGNIPMPAYDLTGAKRLVFYARGETGKERIFVKMGGVNGPYGDSGGLGPAEIKLTRQWKQYAIPLGTINLSRIINGFCCVVNRKDNPQRFSFYLDSIYYDDKE